VGCLVLVKMVYAGTERHRADSPTEQAVWTDNQIYYTRLGERHAEGIGNALKLAFRKPRVPRRTRRELIGF
jgi:hypothetical protein